MTLNLAVPLRAVVCCAVMCCCVLCPLQVLDALHAAGSFRVALVCSAAGPLLGRSPCSCQPGSVPGSVWQPVGALLGACAVHDTAALLPELPGAHVRQLVSWRVN